MALVYQEYMFWGKKIMPSNWCSAIRTWTIYNKHFKTLERNHQHCFYKIVQVYWGDN